MNNCLSVGVRLRSVSESMMTAARPAKAAITVPNIRMLSSLLRLESSGSETGTFRIALRCIFMVLLSQGKRANHCRTDDEAGVIQALANPQWRIGIIHMFPKPASPVSQSILGDFGNVLIPKPKGLDRIGGLFRCRQIRAPGAIFVLGLKDPFHRFLHQITCEACAGDHGV